MRKVLTALVASSLLVLTACSTGPNTDDPLLTQMQDAGIHTGELTESSTSSAFTAICNARDADWSHDWVVDTVRLEFDGTWTDQESMDYVDLAYANSCPEHRP